MIFTVKCNVYLCENAYYRMCITLHHRPSDLN
uniref:Uncharacterized protein n=1 Tax=Siphoviridae sp. ctLmu1 TaxID=2826253 RepID=A0A8S5NH97_9CAUD|nr:MAG TPA: hypothetical protein [Siphoviridae sp. ctLmu1]